MSITDRVTSFIAGEEPGALAIVGKWGQGKTYFWKQVAETHAPGAKGFRPNYAYVSLFGLNSLADLRIELAQQVRSVEHMNDETFGALLGLNGPTWFERLTDRDWWIRLYQRAFHGSKKIADAATGASVGIPHVGNVGPLYRGWAYSRVKKALIGLDDLERRGSGLALKDVMGLVSQLVTERRCSVAVIFNEGTFDEADQAVWAANREKVFLGEVVYSATPETCAGYVFDQSKLADMQAFARTAVLDLGLTNVRIIERIRIACDQASSAVTDHLRPETKERMARCLALYVYMVSGQGEGAPPLSEGRKSSLMRMVDRMNQGADAPPPAEQKKAWDDLLSRYDLHFHGELDGCLMDGVDQGYPNTDRLLEVAEAYDQEVRQQVMDQEFSEAWELFHNTFDDNRQQIIDRMSSAFFRLKATTLPVNADSTIRLMRAFGEEELANRMAQEWIAERTNEQRWKLLEKREVELFHPLQDIPFKTAVEAAYQEWDKKARPSFSAILNSLRQERYIQAHEMTELAEADTDAYFAYFKANPGRSLARIIIQLLTLAPDPDEPQRDVIKARVGEALGRLGEENPTNRVRIEWNFSPNAG
jgi:hypothetical protein